MTAEYTLNPDMTITVHNSGYLVNETRKDEITGKAHCDGSQCYVKFFEWQPEGDYRVVSTDYEDYSIVYSCRQLKEDQKLEYMWILSRHPEQDS